jgi:hypothetical protein
LGVFEIPVNVARPVTSGVSRNAAVPNYKKTSLLQIYGVSRKVDFLLIVEAVE